MNPLRSALGYTKNEIEGKNYMATFVPEMDKDSLSKVFEQIMQIKKPTINVNHILVKDGRQLLVEWNGQPVFKEAGEIDYFLEQRNKHYRTKAGRGRPSGRANIKYRGILEEP